jgi:hypothetical protein
VITVGDHYVVEKLELGTELNQLRIERCGRRELILGHRLM